MSKMLAFAIFTSFFFGTSIAQKPLIGIYGESWPTYGYFEISNNGEFIAYTLSDSKDLFIKSIRWGWQMKVSGAELVAITQDSRRMIFSLGDSIGFLDLTRSTNVTFLEDINTYRVVKLGHECDLLIYGVKQRPDELFIKNVENGEELSYSNVERYWPSDDGSVIVLEVAEVDRGKKRCLLKWLDVRNMRLNNMWEGKKVDQVKIGHNNMQCVFTGTTGADTSGNSIWLYRNTEQSSVKMLDAQYELMKGVLVKSIIVFNDISGRIFINLSQAEINKEIPAAFASVDIWSYKDALLQSQQLEAIKGLQKYNSSITYKAVLNTNNSQMIKLEDNYESVHSYLYDDKPMNYVVLLKGKGGDVEEWNWNDKSRTAVYLVDLNDGSRRLISKDLPGESVYNCVLSYNENYVFYYDPRVKGYRSFNTGNGTRKNITDGVKALWTGSDDKPDSSYEPYEIAGLIKDKDAILVYDQHDLFKIDPASSIKVKNLTHILRRDHNWMFRISGHLGHIVVDSEAFICLNVLNEMNKKTCLIRLSIRSASTPPTIKFESYSLELGPTAKARDKEVYIVERSSVEEHPNLFFTRDFQKYTAITDIHPERGYNWMKAELVSWKTFDGGLSQGILYKPENFDPKKKYPLLVTYYERLSDDLNKFIYPGTSGGLLIIPYYVSHGYLVFEPDIHYRVGWPGRSAYNCVISGVTYLERRSYIDSKKMGLQGHSFGGFETNYIISHSKLFAAAMSASGVSDFVSGYGTIADDGSPRQQKYERGQSRIGAALWEKPTLYLYNSPIFKADKVVTPLLIMANKRDKIVPFQQGVEFFTALRRLDKRAWLLQYDGEGHDVSSRPAQEDLTLRMAQFFNYYLKGDPPPQWMTLGIPASLKGISSGLEIDSSGRKP